MLKGDHKDGKIIVTDQSGKLLVTFDGAKDSVIPEPGVTVDTLIRAFYGTPHDHIDRAKIQAASIAQSAIDAGKLKAEQEQRAKEIADLTAKLNELANKVDAQPGT